MTTVSCAAAESKVAIVVGGSRGIGLQVAQQLLARGWAVCITGRRDQVLEEARKSLAAEGHDALLVRGASEDPEHQRAVVTAALERWSRIDALINNAGTSPYLGNVLDASPEQVNRGLAVNLVAPWSWSKLVYEAHMREHGGTIVNMASIGGMYPVPRVGVYNVTKAALIHLTKQMALEMAPGVRVNAVAPATIKTEFARAKYDGRETEVADQYPLGRLGTAEEVARAIVMLCDDTFGWVTGHIFVLDGGASLIQGVK